MKIKVISRGETEFEADPKHLAPAIREDAEAGKANGDWEVIRQMVSDCTETERSWIDHRHHATVTEDDGAELWEGWLDGRDEPAPGALEARLKAAEAVCVLLGWQANPMGADEEKALHQLWSDWAQLAGPDFTGPDAHPELSDAEIAGLARKRDEIRERTLAAIRGRHPEIAQAAPEAGSPS
jgi:hypothetical protein